MNILGISASPSNYGCCLLEAGNEREVVWDGEFSSGSLESRLLQNGVALADIDLLAVCDNPTLQWQRIMTSCLSQVPEGALMFVRDALSWVRRYRWMKKVFGPKSDFHGETLLVGRHTSYAASAFFQSGFGQAAILTFDAGVELATSSVGVGKLHDISLLAEQYYPHSLELFISAFMPVVGIHDGNVGGFTELAAGGKSHYTDLILSKFLDLKEDGSFRLDMDCFDYGRGRLTISSVGLAILADAFVHNVAFSAQDIARSVQNVAEEIFRKMLNNLYRISGQTKVCVCAQTTRLCFNVGTLLADSAFDQVWKDDACSGATGAALFTWHQYLQ